MDRYGLSTIRTELDDHGVLRVTLDRPERRNAINDVMHRELRELYSRISADTDAEAVVLTGAGRGFCAGGDFQQMADNNDTGYDDGFSQLYVADTSAKKITALTSLYSEYPKGWVLDGTGVLFIRGNAIQNETTGLWRMNPNNTGRTLLVKDAGL